MAAVFVHTLHSVTSCQVGVQWRENDTLQYATGLLST